MRTLPLGILLMGLALAPAQAQERSLLSAGGFSVPRNGSFMPLTTATYQGIAATSVTAGVPVSGLPCFNCITNVIATDAGISMPLAVLPGGSPVTITVLFEDTSYSGPCSVTYFFKQNMAVIQKGTYTYPSGCSANSFNGTYFNVTVPPLPGSTLLQAVVVAGSIKSAAVQAVTIQ
jgi:hypothetical protein